MLLGVTFFVFLISCIQNQQWNNLYVNGGAGGESATEEWKKNEVSRAGQRGERKTSDEIQVSHLAMSSGTAR